MFYSAGLSERTHIMIASATTVPPTRVATGLTCPATCASSAFHTSTSAGVWFLVVSGVVLLTGAGKGFSAGQDLAEVAAPGNEGIEKLLAEQYNPIVTKIRNLPKPVVAAVNGVAAGAGANIALCCDIVLATQSASFAAASGSVVKLTSGGKVTSKVYLP